MVVGSLKSRRTHERVFALTAVPRELTGVLLEAPPFRFGETEICLGGTKRLPAKSFAGGAQQGPAPPLDDVG